MLPRICVFILTAITCIMVCQKTKAADIVCIAYNYSGGFAYVYDDGTISARSASKSFISWCEKFESESKKIKSVALTRQGGFVIIWGKNAYRYSNIPTGLLNRIKEVNTKEQTILSVAVGRNDQWVLLTDEHMYWSDNCPVSLKEKMNTETYNGAKVTMVGFNSQGGYLMQYKKNGRTSYWYSDLTSEQKETFIDK